MAYAVPAAACCTPPPAAPPYGYGNHILWSTYNTLRAHGRCFCCSSSLWCSRLPSPSAGRDCSSSSTTTTAARPHFMQHSEMFAVACAVWRELPVTD
ncbi:hypothetical protein KP509_18G004300 [Ceratopteris richardii]|uniref:Uncharacterized protein n=1 Tax=Ceratopteris richardii TaxID=49495 RepID=A0A8T2SQT2_CERRI|nr:hypothetical protein KP509_18G004300 [Ceratopteris richardii]